MTGAHTDLLSYKNLVSELCLKHFLNGGGVCCEEGLFTEWLTFAVKDFFFNGNRNSSRKCPYLKI